MRARGPALLPHGPQRPRTRERDLTIAAVHLDRANPSSPAGSDPTNLTALMQLEPSRRGRHSAQAAVNSPGAFRWPRR